MAMNVTTQGDITIVELSGSLIGGSETDALRDALQDCIKQNRSKVALDLTRVKFLNSITIGILMATYATYARRGWRIVACGLSKEVHAVFVITKMNQVYEVFDSLKEALEKM